MELGLTWLPFITIEQCKDHVFDFSALFRSCRILIALSSSRLREAGKFFPARLIKYCVILMPEPIPFGLTFFDDMCRAIVSASLVKIPFSGNVETVLTLLTQRLFFLAVV